MRVINHYRDVMNIRVIINSSAGTVRDLSVEGLQQEIREAFGSSGIEPDIRLVEPAKLGEVAREAAQGGYDVVVAVGGDGTVCSVAEGLIGTEIALGVVPLGTFNLFARDFDIPKDINEAVSIIVQGEKRGIDVGKVNDTHFLSYSSVGFYPRLVMERDQIGFRNKREKYLAMMVALYRVLRGMRSLSLWLKSDGTAFRRRTPLVVIGAAEFTFRGGLARRLTQQDDKALMVSIARAAGPFRLVFLAVKEFLHLRSHEEGLETLRTRELTIETGRKTVPVSIDGEVLRIKPPLTYTIKPSALFVMLPKKENESV